MILCQAIRHMSKLFPVPLQRLPLSWLFHNLDVFRQPKMCYKKRYVCKQLPTIPKLRCIMFLSAFAFSICQHFHPYYCNYLPFFFKIPQRYLHQCLQHRCQPTTIPQN
ncbi:hypothetical protein SLEP1_g21278 [Rubroshorea leprosula]|uniref:Uncharacterized protein n=1 Tax=Rubroshorea leprosula TaxID=152421 RepID=A0AAV5JBG5_9ROSI|nr:hypothetical protein SLEP1_g21278 [Rubroshorea leprosula]